MADIIVDEGHVARPVKGHDVAGCIDHRRVKDTDKSQARRARRAGAPGRAVEARGARVWVQERRDQESQADQEPHGKEHPQHPAGDFPPTRASLPAVASC